MCTHIERHEIGAIGIEGVVIELGKLLSDRIDICHDCEGEEVQVQVEWLIRLPVMRDHQTPDQPTNLVMGNLSETTELAWPLFRQQNLNLSFAHPCDENPPLRTSSPLSDPEVTAQVAAATTTTA